jgi:hypothetical protein
MLTRLLGLTTLAIGVCVVAFLYLPSVVLALAVGRLGDLKLGQEQGSATAVVEQSEDHEVRDATARIAVVPDKG